MEPKRCSRCKTGPIENKHRWCRSCQREAEKRRSPASVARKRLYRRRWGKQNWEHVYAYNKAYDAAHPDKVAVWRSKRDPTKLRARQLLNAAVKAGRVKRLPCVRCGDPKSHGHHPDYDKPLEVIWLCVTHHMEVHHGAATS